MLDWKLIAAFLCRLLLAALSVWYIVWWKRGKVRRSGKRDEKMVAKELG